MTELEIDGKTIGSGEKSYIIAEAGTNFRDDIQLAKRLIEEAADAGADAVKFQTHRQSAEMAESAMRERGLGDLYDRIGCYSLSESEHRELQTHCREHGVTFLSTPFSVEGVSLLSEIDLPAIKIGSGELTNYHLLRTAAETGKPLLISTGMADSETVQQAYDFVSEHASAVGLFYCVSEYPATPERFNLGVIEQMKLDFDVPVGFSDHSWGIQAPAVAMARGADIVEKHFTLDRRLPGGDQEVSLEPEELADLVEFAEIVHETDGDTRTVSDTERDIAEWAHHSVVAKTDIEAGTELTSENITTKRPGTGIPASDYYEVVGTSAATDIPSDTVLARDHVTDHS